MAGASFMALLSKRIIAPQSIYTATLNFNSTGNENWSYRGIATGLTAGGNQVRVTFEAPSTGTCTIDHASIGIRATNGDTTATPVELLFSGVAGFSISNGGILVSDWANLTFASSDSLVVIIDVGASNGNLRIRNTTGDGNYEKTATDSYNVAAPAGFTFQADRTRAFNKIESQTI